MYEFGAVDSALAPRTLFYWFDEVGNLFGIVGTHVDDDLFAWTHRFFKEVIPKIRRAFAYAKWKELIQSCTPGG